MSGYPFRVEPGHVLAFARAVGDEDLAARLPEHGTFVPATFPAAALQFDPTHMRGMRPAGSLAAVSANPGGSVLHAEQEFEYFAPVRVGDQLIVTEYEGPNWRKQSRRTGTLAFREIIRDYCNEVGDLVMRSRMVLVDTEFAASDQPGPV